ncbi:MAG: SusC/RagA family TonB-linked outer membrane protein [Chitinophagaceae bacterium]|nr:SusC/RagA family TonB-linked outer membrane protein [Chitinophagaceae bacterium]
MNLKIHIYPRLAIPEIPKLTLKTMKLTAIIILAACIQVSANGYSQITLSERNKPLEKVFQKIQRQSGYDFVSTYEALKEAGNVTVSVRNVTLQKAIEECLKGKPLTYTIVEKTVVIQPKKPDPGFGAALPPPVEIRGTVTDQQGAPLENASVLIVGTNIGTSTNNEGYFRLTAPDNKNITLEISIVGFQTKKVNLGNQTEINIMLEVEASSLNEIVVTSLGIKREVRSLAYATQVVKPKEMIEVQDPNNFLNAFQGKISNALITQSLGGVGSGVNIVLRGDRSIQASSNALIVIDGVPSNFNTPMVNPNDIESITVLKGASAGALYGSQAGNGVIIITTKKGNANGKTSVNLNSGLVVNSAYGLPPMQDEYGQGSGGVLDPMAGSSWGAKMEGQTYTDYKGNTSAYSPQPNNIKDFFESGINLSNSVSVSGGSEKLQGHLSYLNESKRGIVPNNNLMSHNVNLRLTAQISDRLSVDGNFTYLDQEIEDTRRGQKQFFSILTLQIPRNVPYAYAKDFETINSSGLPVPTLWPSPDRRTYQNPYWRLYRSVQPEDLNQTAGYIKVNYKITPWLNVTGNANLSKRFAQTEHKVWDGTDYNPQMDGGTFVKTNTKSEQQWFDLIFDGTNSIAQDLKVNYQFGAIYKNNTNGVDILTASGLYVPNMFSLNYAATSIMNSTSNQIQTQSVFGQVNFSYKDFLYLNASLRNDWVSLLPAPHSYQYYSVGASAILSSMFTLPASISYWKASINYAEVGNGGQFGLLTSVYDYQAGPASGYLRRRGVLPFPDLKPEIVKNLELNTEIKLLNNRLSAEFTYYQSNSFNQLISIDIPPATGYGSKYINAGNIRNRGLEITLGATPVRSQDYSWDIALNFSLNRNKVVELDEKLKTVYRGFFSSNTVTTQITEGGAYGDMYSSYWMKNVKGEYLVNANGLPAISNQAGVANKIIGNFNPREMVGMTNTFNYKQFSLRLLLDGRIGGTVVSGVDMDLLFDGGPEVTAKHREGGWNLNGVDESGNKVGATISAQQFWQWVSSKRYGVGEFFTYDATNLRVREISLGYGIPLSGNAFVKSARLSLVARNLMFLYRGSSILDIPGLGKRKMWFDPDMTGGGGVLDQFAYIPPTRVMGLNLNVNF